MRSFCPNDWLTADIKDVLPDDVAPDTTTLMFRWTRSRTISVHVVGPNEASGKMRRENFRIEMVAPPTATGEITTHARDPSDSRASRMGDRRSSLRPDARAMRSRLTVISLSVSVPTRRRPIASSTHTCFPPTTIISLMSGSSMCVWSGPRP